MLMGGHFLPVQSKEDHFWIEAFCHQPSCYLPFLIFILVFIVWSMSKMFCLVTWWIFPVNSMVVMLILLHNCFFFFKKRTSVIFVYIIFCFVLLLILQEMSSTVVQTYVFPESLIHATYHCIKWFSVFVV